MPKSGKRSSRVGASQPNEQRPADSSRAATIAFRVSTSEASGPSGAGSRADTTREPRIGAEIQLAVPTLGSCRT